MNKHEDLTQKYGSWGDKLLQHTDVLDGIQNRREFKPITIQIAPTEVCDSGCPFCSVSERPLKSSMPFEMIEQVLRDFCDLGAKSVEITGGGNPMLYRRKRKFGSTTIDINDIVGLASRLGYDVGIITNSHKLGKLTPASAEKLSWVRVSLIKLDEGVAPADYDFGHIPCDKLAFSYIIYEDTKGSRGPRHNKPYSGTDTDTVAAMAELVRLHPDVKFVRLVGNCLVKGQIKVRDKWRDVFDAIDSQGKFFMKDIGDNDNPFEDGCYVGMTRPYVAAHPEGNGEYHVYTCTSHVLQKRTYDLDYSLCRVEDITQAWATMNEMFRLTGSPYAVKGNAGRGWGATCKFCYYANNNKLLHTISTEMPDKNFA